MKNTSELSQTLDALIPMHASLTEDGRIAHVGPTLAKVFGGQREGEALLDVFEVERPWGMKSMADLHAVPGQKLHIRLRSEPRTRMKAVMVPHPSGHGALIDMSFGISLIDAVRDFRLTGSDFAVTDLTIEMLYLVEAKSAAMEASRSLTARLQDAMHKAEEQAFTDTLTGLKNRRAFDKLLGVLVDGKRDFSLMHLDLDFFKQVNDTLGHAAGDHVLKEVARIMRAQTRLDDIVARVGGDEFILVFPGFTDRSRLSEVADRLIAKINVPIVFSGAEARVSASCGIVRSIDYVRPSADALIHDADLALYASKDKGRGCYTFFYEMDASKAS